MIETVLSTNAPINALSRCDHTSGTDDGARAEEWSAL